MGSPSGRRSDRVSLALLLEASGKDSQGQEFKDTAKTLMISRHGAVLTLERELSPEQRIHLKRQAPKGRNTAPRGRCASGQPVRQAA